MDIAVIPARGGSKRIPRKNIKLFHGKPMIAWSIAVAQESGCFEHVVVSTDDEEIAEVARHHGAEVPFMRPAELADDFTTTVPVVAHAIRSCMELGWDIVQTCCIYPCAPFIQIGDIKEAYQLLQSSGADYVFPVAEFPSAVQRCLRRSLEGWVTPFYPEHELTRTQDLEPSYYDVGQFYWGLANTWCTNSHIHVGGIGLPVPGWRAVDIDLPADWVRAEKLFSVITEDVHD